MIIDRFYQKGDHIENHAIYANGGFYIDEVFFVEMFRDLMQSLVDYCKHYPVDVLYDVERVRECLRHPADVDGVYTFYFGIRENGVDGRTFVESRLKEAEKYGDDFPYKAMYKMVIDCAGFEGATVTMYTLDRKPLMSL